MIRLLFLITTKLIVIQTPFTVSTTSTILIKLLTTFRPMVSEPINSSLFHQLAEQLQQQNLEQFQKQLLEHQQHQQKVVTTTVYTQITVTQRMFFQDCELELVL